MFEYVLCLDIIKSLSWNLMLLFINLSLILVAKGFLILYCWSVDAAHYVNFHGLFAAIRLVHTSDSFPQKCLWCLYVCIHGSNMPSSLWNIIVTSHGSTYLSELTHNVTWEFCAHDTILLFTDHTCIFFYNIEVPFSWISQYLPKKLVTNYIFYHVSWINIKNLETGKNNISTWDVEEEYKCHSKINITAKEFVVLDEVIISKQCFFKKEKCTGYCLAAL